MQVARGGLDVTVSEQALDGGEVNAGFDHVGGKRVA